MKELVVFIRVALGFALGLTWGVSEARAVEQDFATWTGVTAQGKLTDRFGWYAELQTRVNSDPGFARNTRLLVRPAVRYLLTPEWQLAAGFGWTPNFDPFRNENRLWQQVLHQTDSDGWLIAQRLRFEERWVERTDGVAYRLRGFVRLQKHLADDKVFAVALWDELFWALNDVGRGPQAGFDQNRVFVGPNIGVDARTRLEFGYLNLVNAKGTGPSALVSHVLAVYATFSW